MGLRSATYKGTEQVKTRITERQSWPAIVVIWLIIWAFIALCWGIGWFIAGIFGNDYRAQYVRGTALDIKQYLFPQGILHPLHATLLLYIIVFFCVLITAVLATSSNDSRNEDWAIWSISIVLMLTCLVQGFRAQWDNDKDAGRAFAGSTQYMIANLDKPPSSVIPLIEGAKDGDGKPCAKNGKHDVYSCITVGDPAQSWERRSASATGAAYYMSQAKATNSGTTFLSKTITYTYGPGGNAWTGIRDGKDRQPLDEVLRWDGTGLPTVCRFDGPFEMKYAFAGQWGRSLKDLLADRYPDLQFDDADMWGYCKDAKIGDEIQPLIEPEIVIPMFRLKAYSNRTYPVPAGIVTIGGSPDGEPVLHHYKTVAPGAFPGPVYPLSIAAAQRRSLEWSASRGVQRGKGFGYDPVSGDTDAENTAEFQLRVSGGKDTYWVTPLVTHNSGSQTVVARSVIRSDSVTDGEFNTQLVVVYPDDDARQAVFSNIVTKAQNVVRARDAGFFSQGGKIGEINPVDDTHWQVVVEKNGQPQYVVLVSVDPKAAAEVTDLNTEQPVAGGSGNNPAVDCGKPVKDLSSGDVRACAQRFLDGLASRVPSAA